MFYEEKDVKDYYYFLDELVLYKLLMVLKILVLLKIGLYKLGEPFYINYYVDKWINYIHLGKFIFF
jgi:hypothetical protein